MTDKHFHAIPQIKHLNAQWFLYHFSKANYFVTYYSMPEVINFCKVMGFKEVWYLHRVHIKKGAADVFAVTFTNTDGFS